MKTTEKLSVAGQQSAGITHYIALHLLIQSPTHHGMEVTGFQSASLSSMGQLYLVISNRCRYTFTRFTNIFLKRYLLISCAFAFKGMDQQQQSLRKPILTVWHQRPIKRRGYVHKWWLTVHGFFIVSVGHVNCLLYLFIPQHCQWITGLLQTMTLHLHQLSTSLLYSKTSL